MNHRLIKIRGVIIGVQKGYLSTLIVVEYYHEIAHSGSDIIAIDENHVIFINLPSHKIIAYNVKIRCLESSSYLIIDLISLIGVIRNITTKLLIWVKQKAVMHVAMDES